jgi:hypothetical protein
MLVFDQANFSGTRPLLWLLNREVDSLTFSQELEYGAADRAAVKKVLDTTFIADEAKPLVY